MNSDFEIHKVESTRPFEAESTHKERPIEENISKNLGQEEETPFKELQKRTQVIAYKCFQKLVRGPEEISLPEFKYTEVRSSQDFNQYFKMLQAGLPQNETSEYWDHLKSSFDQYLAEIKKRQAV